MNHRKRQASGPLLPLWSPKHPRTTRGGPHLFSRWLSLGKDAVSLGRDTFSYVMKEKILQPSPPSYSPSISRPHTPDTPPGQRTELSLHHRRPRSLPPSSPSPHPQRFPSSSSPWRPPSCASLECPTSNPPHPPLLFSQPTSVSPHSPHRPPPPFQPRPLLASSLQTTVSPPQRSDSRLTTATLPLPTINSSASGMSIPYYSSSKATYSQIDDALESAMHRNKHTEGIQRNYRNREHIYAGKHKIEVRVQRKRDREEMVKELYDLKRSSGYTSDFATFQGYLNYGERLSLLERRQVLSPSTSLTDLRSKSRTPAPSRRHSFSEDFLQRALEKAREALNGPKPPKPFSPSLDRLRHSARVKDEEIERRLRGSKRAPLPASLPPEDEIAVDTLLTKKGIVSKFAREQVTDKDISRLRPGEWLNDEIINFYGQLIMSRADGCKENPVVNGVNGKSKALNVHYFSTFFWSKLKAEGYEKSRLAKWTKKFDLFQKDIVLIPINHNNSHWTAAGINFRRKRIESYDSMNMRRNDVYQHLRLYVDAEHRNKKKKPFDFTGWEDHTLPDTPQQENGFDCGVFTCQFLAALARGEECFNFHQVNMAYLRRRMIWEIGHATLRDEI